MLIADVLATIATLVLSALTTWATLLAFGLLFPQRTEMAARELTARGPWRNGGVGLALLIGIGGVMFALISAGPPPAKLLGLAGLGWLLSLSAIGGAALTGLIAPRIDPREGFSRAARAAGILVGAANLPILGWFVFAPLTLAVATGAGAAALWRSARDVSLKRVTA